MTAAPMKKLLFLTCVLLAGCSESPDETRRLYEAWKHANREYSHLSLEDWSILRSHEMLPGVDYAKIYAKQAKESAESAATTSAINLGVSAAK
jgi:hypothetical protein